MYKRIVIPVILLFFVLQTSCLLLVNENSEAKTEESTETAAEADVVATVNGEKVFRKDFDRRMNVIRRMNQEVTRSTEIMVKKQLDNGADFAEMARKYSTCPSAENGGDIGFFQRKGSIVEEFAIVAFSMEVGEISEPVETQFGYHIIKVTDKEEGKDISYEDV